MTPAFRYSVRETVQRLIQATGYKLQTTSKRSSIALAFISTVSVIAAGVAPAQALTLMDIIRGGPGKRAPSYDSGLPGVDAGRQAPRNIDPQPLPKVSGPKYHVYKADPARLVKTAGFAANASTGPERLLAEAKVSAPSDIAAALEAFYGKSTKPLWISAGDINEKGRDVLALFDRAQEFGLDPADYRLAPPELVTASTQTVSATVSDASKTPVGSDHDRALMQFELALSAKALMFAQDMIRGRLDPNRISGYHDFKRKDVKLSLVLPFIRSGEDAAGYLEGLIPQSDHFLALKDELARLRAEEADEGQRIALPENLLLKPGATSPELANVVAAIRKHGSDALKEKHSAFLASYQQDDQYTPAVVDLVKGFQDEAGLKPDGVIGPATVRAMVGHSVAAKIDKLTVAMEQARWLPADLGGRHVFINQPAYTASYHDGGTEQFSMRVVIGSKANQTYFFQDQIETVEFNPYWGVPQSIIINEMLPHLRADPSYLDRMGYQVEVNGRPVSSTSVNWYGSTQSIAVRQPPSSDNALGELKILFPNEHAIYMHDTPSKSFFKRDMRALSHGCIRLAEPRKMAAAVLGVSEQEIGAKIAKGKNIGETVSDRIPVYVAYFTAWPNKDGVVEYFDDVYDRDAATLKALKATSTARVS
ncbi:peptidoglycan-binding protein [Pseudorhizobium endolithicum]|uniref:Peptidoglycan-binding protein n=1 Tax=Pseudorhizobium endolithicum TaxID=1191678 RepID=A0ABM8PRZ9_9HYPH|nr:L,D-transpeptidase family protein [Pseudorhizobium endolithicum]CAD7045263.1 peptidoglycan-binding protein [Pseudorhizobium endolithicum]